MHTREISPESLKEFQAFVWDFYKQEKRLFAWRETTNPYFIVVSEIMLQQTQTSRVVEKYNLFIYVIRKPWPF